MSRRQTQRLDVVFVAVMELVSGGKLTQGVRRTPLIVLVAAMELVVSGGNLSRGVRRIPYVFLVAVCQCVHSCVSAFIVLEERTDREDSEKYVQKYPEEYHVTKTSTET